MQFRTENLSFRNIDHDFHNTDTIRAQQRNIGTGAERNFFRNTKKKTHDSSICRSVITMQKKKKKVCRDRIAKQYEIRRCTREFLFWYKRSGVLIPLEAISSYEKHTKFNEFAGNKFV